MLSVSHILRGYAYMYRATGNSYFLSKFVPYADLALAQRDDKRGIKDWEGRSAAGWSNFQVGDDDYIVEITGENRVRGVRHDSLVIEPMVDFATIIYSDSSLHAAYKAKADEYIKAAEEVVAAHESEWKYRTFTGPFAENVPTGWYRLKYYDYLKEEYGLDIFPTFDAFNRNVTMGEALIKLGDLVGRSNYPNRSTARAAEYTKKAQAMGTLLKAHLMRVKYDNQDFYIFPNAAENVPRRVSIHPNPRLEDFSHGALTMRFVQAAHQYQLRSLEDNTLLFPRAVMTRLAQMTLRLYPGNYDGIYGQIGGDLPESVAEQFDRGVVRAGTLVHTGVGDLGWVGHWAHFANFNPAVMDMVKNYYDRNLLSERGSFTRVGVGLAYLTEWHQKGSLTSVTEPDRAGSQLASVFEATRSILARVRVSLLDPVWYALQNFSTWLAR
ncbi:MAG: hypothetical protein Q8P19_00755 [bacterium]|nr:hypothetical protein [bacterium]